METATRISIVLIPALTALAAAAEPAPASDPAKKAVKKIEKATDAALETLRETLELVEKQLDADLDLIDLDVKGGGGQLSDAALTFNALKSFQSGVATAMEGACVALQAALAAADVLNDPALPAEDLPKGLAFGDGGLCDDYRDAVVKAVDQSVARGEKRMRKTAAAFEKHADIGFFVRLHRPREFVERPGPIATAFGVFEHSIAVLMSASRLDATQENRLFAYGICGPSDDLTLTILSSASPSSANSVTVAGGAWERTIVDTAPGYYVLRIHHDMPGGGGAFGAINVR